MVTHSSILGWRIPWTEQPGWLLSIGSQRVRYDWSALAQHKSKSSIFSVNSLSFTIWATREAPKRVLDQCNQETGLCCVRRKQVKWERSSLPRASFWDSPCCCLTTAFRLGVWISKHIHGSSDSFGCTLVFSDFNTYVFSCFQVYILIWNLKFLVWLWSLFASTRITFLWFL